MANSGDYCFEFLGQHLHLLPQKAIFWREANTLLLADLHLGKVSHFRKAGIALPGTAALRDYEVLSALLDRHVGARVVLLGDLFHSVANAEWALFADWMRQYPTTAFVLVKGNHDILPAPLYHAERMTVFPETWHVPPFVFSHIALPEPPTNGYNLSGHVHPAVRLSGRGSQQLVLPCFYFRPGGGLLPAFGSLTGRATIQAVPGSQVFVVTPNAVLPV